MLYLNKTDISAIPIDWDENISNLEYAVECLSNNDFSQPIKPYLKFKDPNDRIIAMPAYVGGDISATGIKWIASFPKNIKKTIPRAHSITVLNDVNTGEPKCIINTALISGIRTASVSGLMIRKFQAARNLDKINIGIIGFGPIGQLHYQMVTELLNEKIDKICIFDLAGISMEKIPTNWLEKTEICSSWEDVYKNSDIFITCTVSEMRYINKEPKKGALLLNVSLRDYEPSIIDFTQSIIVDDWDEVCRANTDIEVMHKERNLNRESTKSIVDVVLHNAMNEFPDNQAIMFHPMGMAIFDITIAKLYFEKAKKNNIGLILD
ncbi:2,3-diaminopropionate biosynthesis protein SbnB [Lysinibacillus sp. fls2-241-R2A-57]|uniref:2,3-diaminopropionate biosynthesis protein SbnB n=1 Tax=Lysinibacillus sp. fls2-241-R2A-57 TaxID=3040292 RepID=UPI00255585D4|nr:2,3-diaminopropionate biosynthesis protein SbnB [Lysinibacillus sp. fls2-241-R2A-57]